MPDTLTPDEIAAIAAFPADQVQRIPVATSSWSYVYDPSRTGWDKLRSTKPMGWREQITAEYMAHKRARHNLKRKAAVQTRRALVIALHEQGKTRQHIAAHLGVSEDTIRTDIKAVMEAKA